MEDITLGHSMSSPFRQPPPTGPTPVSPQQSAPLPSVPQPGSQCHCLSILSEMKVKLIGMTQQLSVLTNFVNVYMPSQHPRQPTDVPPPSATSHTPPETPPPDEHIPEAATVTPDSDPEPDQPHEENQSAPSPDIPAQPKQKHQKRRVLLPTPPLPSFYPRPSVWLPGYGPPTQPPVFWQPRRGRSKSRSKHKGNALLKDPSVANLIDLH